MKFLVLLPLFAALLVVGCGEREKPLSAAEIADILLEAKHTRDLGEVAEAATDITSLSLYRDHGLWFQKRDNRAFTGWLVYRNKSGQIETFKRIKDGQENGLYSSWYKTGLKREEGTYKDGKLDGSDTSWHENGQKAYELSYKDGKLDGIFRSWHENGQKRTERTYKDGKRYGPMTGWHENGQKRSELMWKGDKLVSAKYWNSKGEEVETEGESKN